MWTCCFVFRVHNMHIVSMYVCVCVDLSDWIQMLLFAGSTACSQCQSGSFSSAGACHKFLKIETPTVILIYAMSLQASQRVHNAYQGATPALQVDAQFMCTSGHPQMYTCDKCNKGEYALFCVSSDLSGPECCRIVNLHTVPVRQFLRLSRWDAYYSNTKIHVHLLVTINDALFVIVKPQTVPR